MDKKDPSGGPAQGIGRRTLLTAAGATALAGAVGVSGTPAAGASPGRRVDADVIVIGAGFAGITAARELRAAGLRPLILEARNRVGGRTWTGTFAGESVEFGGQWLGSAHTLAMAELTRYGIGLVPGGIAPQRAFYPTANGAMEFDFQRANTHLGELTARLFDGSTEYFPRPLEPLYRSDLLAAVDPLSLRDRLNQLGLVAQDELWLSGMTAVYCGGSSALGGLSALAQWWALSGWNPQGWDSLLEFRPEGGMAALLDAILTDAHADLWLDTPVSAVVDDGHRVTVGTSRGDRVSALAVVVAVPVNLWRTIRFSPHLPRAHAAAAAAGIGVPNATKLLLRLTGNPGAVTAMGTEGAPFAWVIPQAELVGGDQLAVAFSSDPTIDLTSARGIEAKLRDILPGARVRDFRAQQWARDSYSRGGWGLRRPSQLLAHFPAIQRPHGRMAFATGDIASGWNGGFVEGAMESGRLAASQILDLL